MFDFSKLSTAWVFLKREREGKGKRESGVGVGGSYMGFGSSLKLKIKGKDEAVWVCESRGWALPLYICLASNEVGLSAHVHHFRLTPPPHILNIDLGVTLKQINISSFWSGHFSFSLCCPLQQKWTLLFCSFYRESGCHVIQKEVKKKPKQFKSRYKNASVYMSVCRNDKFQKSEANTF